MRAREFISEEIVYEEKFGGYDLLYTRHFFDRIRERGISPEMVQNILKRLGRARRQIDDIGVETSISIHDRREGIHIIVAKPDSADNKLHLLTAFKDTNYTGNAGKTPIIPVR